MYATSTAPEGWLLCDGAEYLKTAYPALDVVLSNGGTYPYGQTNGSGGVGTTHFRTPNTKGIFVRGAGSQTIGAETYSATLGTRQNDATAVNGLTTLSAGAHVHDIQFWDSGGTPPARVWGGGTGAVIRTDTNAIQSAGAHTHTLTGDTETRPANIALNYIIKY